MVAYGFGDAGTGLAATLLGFYLFPFFTCAAGLPAFIAGSLLTVIKVWDALNDPLIGWMSDHTQSRWGPRLPWMLGASLPQGISLVLCRDPKLAHHIRTEARYQARAESIALGKHSAEGSRPANALYLHSSLHLLGHKGYGLDRPPA